MTAKTTPSTESTEYIELLDQFFNENQDLVSIEDYLKAKKDPAHLCPWVIQSERKWL